LKKFIYKIIYSKSSIRKDVLNSLMALKLKKVYLF